MANLIDWLAGKKSVECSEGEGLNLAIQTVEEFEGRTFRCRDKKSRYSGISSEEIRRFIQEELPDYYNYTTKIKKYIDRKRIPQAEIEIMGNIGLSTQLNRYNPLNRTFHIMTERPKAAVAPGLLPKS